MTAGKETGAVRAPISKLVCAETTAPRAALQPCTHSVTVTERLPDGSPHFSKEICIQCGAFVRWLPKPQNVERRTLNSFKLAKLAMVEGLSKWERSFVADISKRRKLSPKQEALVERLCREYLEGAP